MDLKETSAEEIPDNHEFEGNLTAELPMISRVEASSVHDAEPGIPW